MKATTHLLDRGIQLSKAGNQEDARRLLEAVILQEQGNEAAWFWYANSFPAVEKRITVLEQFLEIDPANHRAIRTVAILKAQSTALSRPAAQIDQRAFTRQQPRAQRVIAGSYQGHLITALVLILGAGAMAISVAFTLYQEYTNLHTRYDAVEIQLQETQHDHRILQESHEMLAGQHEGLQGQYTTLQGEHSTLQDEHLKVQEQNGILLSQNSALQDEKTVLQDHVVRLQDQNSGLANDVSALMVKQQRLRGKLADLEEQYRVLGDEHGVLEEQYSSLMNEYLYLEDQLRTLEETSVRAPFIITSGRNVNIAFNKVNGSLQIWQFPFERLEAAVKRGEELRDRPARVPLENRKGTVQWVVDASAFINSKDLAGLAAELYSASPDDDAFIKEIWSLVGNLVVYTNDGNFEIPRSPLETLLGGGGDCEDTSILLASLIKAAPVDWKVELFYMDSDQPEDPQEANHVIVHINTGSSDYYIETTRKDEMQPYQSLELSGWYFELN